MAIQANDYYVNDFSSELIMMYQCLANADKTFFNYIELFDESWLNSLKFFNNHTTLVDIYVNYRNGEISNNELKAKIVDFCDEHQNEINNIVDVEFQNLPSVLLKEMQVNLYRKMTRMKVLELEKHILPDDDLNDNIETAIKSAVYMNYRFLYNNKEINNDYLHCALFFFMRNYSYSGMFRYSSNGDFNVPYGGIAYNSKLMGKKLMYYRSDEFRNHFKNAKIFNLDFEDFLRQTNPSEGDFVFLDPPYDTEFSTYAQNEFSKQDQERLANYMINECRAKWMLIIKNTDFIYNLYNRQGINIRTFDKEYLVSFMNRNDKKVTHLLITNY